MKQVFFLKPLPSAYNWSVFIGFLGILIMAYCDENCGCFLPPYISLSIHRNQPVGRVKVCHQTECQVCQGNSALIFPETGEDFLSCFWPAWKFGQDMARWCCCSYFMQKNILVFYFYSVSCFPFFSSVYMLVAKKNQWQLASDYIHHYLLLTSTPAIGQIYWRHKRFTHWAMSKHWFTNGPPS